MHVKADDPASGRFSIGASVTLTTKSGEIYARTVQVPRGHPTNPLSRDEHLACFRECLEYAGDALPPRNMERILSTIERLEETGNVLELIPLLRVRRKAKQAA